MSKTTITIPRPCDESLAAMPRCEKGLYCGSCQKHVLDLRKMDREKVETVLEQNPGACVVMDSRHVSGKKAWSWAENFAESMRRYRFNRVAAFFLALCLFLASCRRRQVAGCPAYGKDAGPQQKTEQL